MDSDKLRLLKSLHLLDTIPDEQLSALGEFLKPLKLEDGAVIFEEASQGDSLYFVTSGHVRISKRVSGEAFKDLAILSAGDCFGEMVLFEKIARSARAAASGETVVFELGRDDLNRWLKSHPELAMEFFAQLVQVQSKRLRRTSSELTLLFDLSNLLLESSESGKDLLSKVLDRVLPHLENSWSASAYLYNMFNDEMDLAASRGAFDFDAVAGKLPPPATPCGLWINPGTYYVSLPGKERPLGYLLFHSSSNLTDEERNELGRALKTVAQLLTAALENIGFRTEETLRARLKIQTYGTHL